MKLLCLARGYASYGGSIVTFAAQHLELRLKDLEPTDLAIEAVAFLRHEGPPKRTLERLLEQHNLRFPHQMRARYRAKVRKLEVEYPSTLRESESFGKPGGIYAAAHVLPRALDELSGAIVEALRSKPAIWNKVEASQLTEAIERSKASLPQRPDQVAEYMRELDEARRASVRNRGSIDDLDTKWDKSTQPRDRYWTYPSSGQKPMTTPHMVMTQEATCSPHLGAGTSATPPRLMRAMSTAC